MKIPYHKWRLQEQPWHKLVFMGTPIFVDGPSRADEALSNIDCIAGKYMLYQYYHMVNFKKEKYQGFVTVMLVDDADLIFFKMKMALTEDENRGFRRWPHMGVANEPLDPEISKNLWKTHWKRR